MKVTINDLRQVLGRHPRASSAELCSVLKGINRSTLSRLIAQIDGDIVRRGGSRRIRYALRRALRGRAHPIPLFCIDANGNGHSAGALELTYPEGSALECASPFVWPLATGLMSDGWFEGLPYPLYDMRPQGFLGRNFAHHYSRALDVPENLLTWSDDDLVHVLSNMGADQSGELILGERAYQRFLDSQRDWESRLITDKALPGAYPARAELALSQGLVGSSAGGEFPKFTAMREIDGRPVAVITKFSGADNSPAVRRWSDLLVCEHIALTVVASELGIPSAASALHQYAGRTFLEVQRFDREGAFGRRPVCSLSSLNGALLGMAGQPWPTIAQALRELGCLSAGAAAQITTLWWFGRLIANTDMHDGNLSFLPGLAVAPVYDMLPMRYAPLRAGEVPAQAYEVARALPTQNAEWQVAARAALAFWARCASDQRIGEEFRAISRENAATVMRALDG